MCVCVNYLLYNKLPDGWAVCVCVCVCVCLCVSSRKSSIIYNNTPCVVFFVCIYKFSAVDSSSSFVVRLMRECCWILQYSQKMNDFINKHSE